MADAGVAVWRNEAFDVRADPDGPVLATIDRGLLPALGLRAVGAHLNGLVHRADGPLLWIARRSNTKLLDPGKLDHIAAGGVEPAATPPGRLGGSITRWTGRRGSGATGCICTIWTCPSRSYPRLAMGKWRHSSYGRCRRC